jgi:hypothetical protein
MPSAQISNTANSKSKQQVDNKIAKAAERAKEQRLEQQQQQQQQIESQQEMQQSTTNSTGNKTPQEHPEFIKQALVIIEKKVRNLEKRRQKLEEYKDSEKKGESLNADQKQAIERYDEVIRTLDLARELEKQFMSLANDALKQQRKQAKRDQMEREDAVRDRVRETQRLLAVLNLFAQNVSNVRAHFLNEQNGAVKLTESELNLFDEFRKLVQVSELSSQMDTVLTESADHLIWLLEGKNKPITRLCTEQTQVTYSDLKKLFDRVLECAYWRQDATASSSLAHHHATSVVEQPTEIEPQQQQQQQQQANEQETLGHTEQIHTNVYNQQNTSDDYVMVSSNDFADQTNQANKQSKAYFSTLNQTTDNRHINEFLNQNNDEGINFLQDSEIQTRTQQAQPQDTLENIENYQHQAEQQQGFDSSNQEFKNDPHNREFRQQRGNGYRGGYQKGRYSDERRGGHSGPRQHNGPRPNNSNWSNSRGGGSGSNSGNRGSYRPRGGAGGNQGGYRQPQQQQQQVVQ